MQFVFPIVPYSKARREGGREGIILMCRQEMN